MGRPSLSQHKRKTHVIAFRVSARDYRRLASLAEEANLRINHLARDLALSRSDTLTVKTHAKCDPALLKRLERIGHNLNQLVRNAHIFGRVSPKIPKLCEQIEGLVLEAIEGDDEP